MTLRIFTAAWKISWVGTALLINIVEMFPVNSTHMGATFFTATSSSKQLLSSSSDLRSLWRFGRSILSIVALGSHFFRQQLSKVSKCS
jgi:hypothetical protein